MLYDPKWEVKTDPFTLPSLISWLELQPAAGTYEYTNPRNCMLCQYFRAMGFPVRSIVLNYLTLEAGEVIDIPRQFHWDVANFSGRTGGTFGAALKRARAIART